MQLIVQKESVKPLICDECGEKVAYVVRFGLPHSMHSFNVCRDCFYKSAALWKPLEVDPADAK